MARKLTRGERVIKFAETMLVVPEGDLVGKPIVLEPFQKKFILDVYDHNVPVRVAILSIARKNAKTGTIAIILLAHLVGPESKRNSRIISGANSRDQAGEVYNLASKMVLLSPKITDLVHIVPASKRMVGKPLNVEYQAISAEGKTAHGKSPILAILDEVGQIQGPQSDFVDAITTAQGAYEDPLLIYISTQAATDADFFSILIDDALTNKPADTVCHVYAAAADAEIMDEAAWYAANPALGKFRSLKDVRAQAEKAARMPSFENTFRNLILNQRVSVFAPFVSRDVWKSCEGVGVIPAGADIYGGLDLSSVKDLTAFALVALVDGKIVSEVYAWMPEKAVRDRAREDRVAYDVWAREGWLRTCPGSTIDYEWVASDILRILDGRPLVSIAFDRWRIDYFRKSAAQQGITLPLVEYGQGFKDMAPAVDALEAALLNGQLVHDANPILTMCAANASVLKDPSGNRKFDKRRPNARIDMMVALAMAVGSMVGNGAQLEKPLDYSLMFSDPLIA